MADRDIEITINVVLTGTGCKVTGKNLAHINAVRLRNIEKAIQHAVKMDRLGIIRKESKAARDESTKIPPVDGKPTLPDPMEGDDSVADAADDELDVPEPVLLDNSPEPPKELPAAKTKIVVKK